MRIDDGPKQKTDSARIKSRWSMETLIAGNGGDAHKLCAGPRQTFKLMHGTWCCAEKIQSVPSVWYYYMNILRTPQHSVPYAHLNGWTIYGFLSSVANHLLRFSSASKWAAYKFWLTTKTLPLVDCTLLQARRFSNWKLGQWRKTAQCDEGFCVRNIVTDLQRTCLDREMTALQMMQQKRCRNSQISSVLFQGHLTEKLSEWSGM